MKKTIKFLGMIAIALTVFMMSSNNSEDNNSISDLLSVEIANAYNLGDGNPSCENDPGDKCKVYGTTIKNCDEAETNGCKDGGSVITVE